MREQLIVGLISGEENEATAAEARRARAVAVAAVEHATAERRHADLEVRTICDLLAYLQRPNVCISETHHKMCAAGGIPKNS